MRLAIVLLLSSLSFAQGMGGKSGIGGKAGFGGGLSVTTPSVVQACGKNTTTSSTSITWSASCSQSVTVGNWEVIFLNLAGNPTTVSCADSLVNTYTAAVFGTLFSNEAYCYSHLTIGGADTITVTLGGAQTPTSENMELSNVSAFDAATTESANASSTSWTCPTVTTTASGDIVLCGGGDNGANATYTGAGGYTIPTGACAASGVCGQVSGSNQSSFIEWLVVGAASTYSPTATLNTALAGRSVTLAFKN